MKAYLEPLSKIKREAHKKKKSSKTQPKINTSTTEPHAMVGSKEASSTLLDLTGTPGQFKSMS